MPKAGLEKNGLHVALGKHRFIVCHEVERISKKHWRSLIAPAIDYVPERNIHPTDGHICFAGTISIPPDVSWKSCATSHAACVRTVSNAFISLETVSATASHRFRLHRR